MDHLQKLFQAFDFVTHILELNPGRNAMPVLPFTLQLILLSFFSGSLYTPYNQ